ncbi:MAG TPA: hypothetical protein VEL11_06715 [Candidatus Bathyarchaeia archaeon]|nr:hypothetical protein [Candidatus Bathyarchaeia archaeon]
MPDIDVVPLFLKRFGIVFSNYDNNSSKEIIMIAMYCEPGKSGHTSANSLPVAVQPTCLEEFQL